MTFLEVPVVGSKARFHINGAEAISSPVQAVDSDPARPGWYRVMTASGSAYHGMIQTDPACTVYQQVPQWTPPSAVPGGTAPFGGLIPDGPVPAEVARGLNWGAFLLAPFWSIAHEVWIGLLACVPAFGLAMAVALLLKGNQWGWRCRHFHSVDQFRAVQRAWMIWGLVVQFVNVVIGLAYVVLSMVPFLFMSAAMQPAEVSVVTTQWHQADTLTSPFGAESRPAVGRVYVIATITVTNTDRSKTASVSSRDFELVGNNNNAYRPDGFSSYAGIKEVSGTLLPGGSTSGQVVFEVDTGVQPVSVRYSSAYPF